MSKKSPPPPRRGYTRRQFIAGAAGAAGGLALPGCGVSLPGGIDKAAAAAGLPAPEASGFDHVVVVMMENRSFDHFLGWVPGADGRQAGTTLPDRDGNPQQSYDLAPGYQNCDLADPDHSYEGGRTHVGDGKMDGFLKTQPVGDRFPIGYYTADSLPFYKGAVAQGTVCDRYFSGILSSTTPNRFYMHAGQTDRVSNTVDISSLPTVWDRMLEAGRSVAYWYTDVSYISFWGDKFKSFSKKYSMDSFARDVAAAPLPNLMFVDNVGNTLNEYGALSMDDHPYGDIRDGQAFLNQVYNTLRQHPDWERTLMIINYDEWGGFYDHVEPPLAAVSEAEKALGNDGRLGCRVPCVLLGPRVRRGHVEHTQFDPNSILNMLAWRFGFEPLGVRGDSANIALALDFQKAPDVTTAAFDVAKGPFGGLCVPFPLLEDYTGLPIPDIPLPPIPLPIELQLPPIPGFDVPLPTLLRSGEMRLRRFEHDLELEALRSLGKTFGL